LSIKSLPYKNTDLENPIILEHTHLSLDARIFYTIFYLQPIKNTSLNSSKFCGLLTKEIKIMKDAL